MGGDGGQKVDSSFEQIAGGRFSRPSCSDNSTCSLKWRFSGNPCITLVPTGGASSSAKLAKIA